MKSYFNKLLKERLGWTYLVRLNITDGSCLIAISDAELNEYNFSVGIFMDEIELFFFI